MKYSKTVLKTNVNDASLINPIAIVEKTCNFWISANGSSRLLNYNKCGQPLGFVVIPDSNRPTGLVANRTTGFNITSGPNTAPSTLITVTENGIVYGYNATVDSMNAILAVDNSSTDAVYKGLAIDDCKRRIYATDFFNNKIDTFDSTFTPVALPFTDPNMPTGFAPFGISNICGKLYVTYAKQLAPNNNVDQPGVGNGFINVFDYNGVFIRRLVSNGVLNSPWGLTTIKAECGCCESILLVGNVGDGKINAFNMCGKNKGQIVYKGCCKQPIVTDGLWGIDQAYGKLYFVAGGTLRNIGAFGYLNNSC
jgi:uncharacterized protein (TIGR03118 family)